MESAILRLFRSMSVTCFNDSTSPRAVAGMALKKAYASTKFDELSVECGFKHGLRGSIVPA